MNNLFFDKDTKRCFKMVHAQRINIIDGGNFYNYLLSDIYTGTLMKISEKEFLSNFKLCTSHNWDELLEKPSIKNNRCG